MCQKVYFPAEDCSTAFVTVVKCGLWRIFNNFAPRDVHQHGLDQLEFERAKALCKRSLNDTARRTQLVLAHSYRHIQALLLLVRQMSVGLLVPTDKPQAAFLMETSRPSLALSFASACARLCQDAGYHCLTFDSSDPQAQQKIVTFWVVFLLDRGLSLNFGRSPSLQDYDVTASRPALGDSNVSQDLFCSVGVELAYLQGDIYQKLYSGCAQRVSTNVKAQRARVLADRVVHLHRQLATVGVSSKHTCCPFG